LHCLDISQAANHGRIPKELRAIVDGDGHAAHDDRIATDRLDRTREFVFRE
jgi:hypothetical protein